MQNYELGADEVILYEGMVRNTQVKESGTNHFNFKENYI